MPVLVNKAVLTELRSLYPALNIKPLTAQQERLVMLLLEGSNLSAAARGAGYSSNNSAREFLNSDTAGAVMEYYRERRESQINITRDQINRMYLELYQERTNANEGARVLEGMARLNGLNEEARQRTPDVQNITINQQNNTVHQLSTMDEATVRKKMETMDAKKLIEHASPRFEGFGLDPEEVKEAEVVDVPVEADSQEKDA